MTILMSTTAIGLVLGGPAGAGTGYGLGRAMVLPSQLLGRND